MEEGWHAERRVDSNTCEWQKGEIYQPGIGRALAFITTQLKATKSSIRLY
jgi:hypothetical protein